MQPLFIAKSNTLLMGGKPQRFLKPLRFRALNPPMSEVILQKKRLIHKMYQPFILKSIGGSILFFNHFQQLSVLDRTCNKILDTMSRRFFL